jgi:hypothetical protein
MNCKLVVQPPALADLDEAYQWIAERSPENTTRWFNRFLEALQTLRRFADRQWRGLLRSSRPTVQHFAIREIIQPTSARPSTKRIKNIASGPHSTAVGCAATSSSGLRLMFCTI